ncbi:MAG TPA: hypothetical protein VNA31_10830 [bacterium]|nr:hypothetical protein [bacterium]
MTPAHRRLVVFALTLALFASACGGKPAQTHVTVVLFHVTGSTYKGNVRGQYLTDFAKILNGPAAGGVLVGDVIDDNPLAHSSYPINVTFEPFNPMAENKLDYQRRVRQQREEVIKTAEALVRKPPSGRLGHNIIDAMQLAESAFATFRGDHELLVIFSDMIEQSKRYDFTGENLTAARIDQIINQERSAGRVPDLRGVDVCVVGAGSCAQSADRPALSSESDTH